MNLLQCRGCRTLLIKHNRKAGNPWASCQDSIIYPWQAASTKHVFPSYILILVPTFTVQLLLLLYEQVLFLLFELLAWWMLVIVFEKSHYHHCHWKLEHAQSCTQSCGPYASVLYDLVTSCLVCDDLWWFVRFRELAFASDHHVIDSVIFSTGIHDRCGALCAAPHSGTRCCARASLGCSCLQLHTARQCLCLRQILENFQCILLGIFKASVDIVRLC